LPNCWPAVAAADDVDFTGTFSQAQIDYWVSTTDGLP
jgi:hypothetical protein